MINDTNDVKFTFNKEYESHFLYKCSNHKTKNCLSTRKIYKQTGDQETTAHSAKCKAFSIFKKNSNFSNLKKSLNAPATDCLSFTTADTAPNKNENSLILEKIGVMEKIMEKLIEKEENINILNKEVSTLKNTIQNKDQQIKQLEKNVTSLNGFVVDLNLKLESNEKDGAPFKKPKESILLAEKISREESHNLNVTNELSFFDEPSEMIKKSIRLLKKVNNLPKYFFGFLKLFIYKKIFLRKKDLKMIF